MKRALAACAGVLFLTALAVGLWFLLEPEPPAPVQESAPRASPSAPGDVPAPMEEAQPVSGDGAASASTPVNATAHSPGLPAPVVALPADHPARIEADSIALNLRHFGQRFGGNPVGTNAEIVRYLNGGNPQGVRYLPQEYQRFNEAGELLDPWGTPYFFHQVSAKETEIRSAGPDRVLWTGDDVLAK